MKYLLLCVFFLCGCHQKFEISQAPEAINQALAARICETHKLLDESCELQWRAIELKCPKVFKHKPGYRLPEAYRKYSAEDGCIYDGIPRECRNYSDCIMSVTELLHNFK